MKKTVYVACGGAVATSTVAADRIRTLLADNGIEADVHQCRISELDAVSKKADVIVTTAKVDKDYDIPVIHGVSFITGINTDVAEEKILEALN